VRVTLRELEDGSAVTSVTGPILLSAFPEGLSSHPEIRAGVQGAEGDHDDHGDHDRRHRVPPKRIVVEVWV
jgi:hypothetical protein